MMTELATFAAAALFAVAPASTPAAPAPAPPPPAATTLPPTPAAVAPLPAEPALPHVTLTTTLGPIVVRIDNRRAPVSGGNFLRYVDARRMDGFLFYRTTRSWGEHSQLVQAGNRGDARRNFPMIRHEPTTATGLTHCPGALSMARMAPGTASSDFFVLLSDIPGFDANPEREGDKDGFAVFGEVVSGMDILRKIYDAPVSATEGKGVMAGQILAAPVRIVTARRTPPPAEPFAGCIATPRPKP